MLAEQGAENQVVHPTTVSAVFRRRHTSQGRFWAISLSRENFFRNGPCDPKLLFSNDLRYSPPEITIVLPISASGI